MMPQIYIIKIFRKMKKKKKWKYIYNLWLVLSYQIMSNNHLLGLYHSQIRSQNLTTGWIDICKDSKEIKYLYCWKEIYLVLGQKIKKKIHYLPISSTSNLQKNATLIKRKNSKKKRYFLKFLQQKNKFIFFYCSYDKS